VRITARDAEVKILAFIIDIEKLLANSNVELAKGNTVFLGFREA
jgi:hypothetical protein